MSDRSQSGQSSQMGGGQGGAAASRADTALAQKVVQQLKQQLPSIQNIQAMRPGTIFVIINKGTVTRPGCGRSRPRQSGRSAEPPVSPR
jgi:hypothetical protein